MSMKSSTRFDQFIIIVGLVMIILTGLLTMTLNGVFKAINTSKEIDEEVISDHLYTSDLPDPDLMIRTSGENRISNFLLWQIAYSELYITPILWPDFRKQQFFEAIRSFQQRERRYGMVSEQLESE